MSHVLPGWRAEQLWAIISRWDSKCPGSDTTRSAKPNSSFEALRLKVVRFPSRGMETVLGLMGIFQRSQLLLVITRSLLVNRAEVISCLPWGAVCLEVRALEATQCFMKNPSSRRWSVFLPWTFISAEAKVQPGTCHQPSFGRLQLLWNFS